MKIAVIEIGQDMIDLGVSTKIAEIVTILWDITATNVPIVQLRFVLFAIATGQLISNL